MNNNESPLILLQDLVKSKFVESESEYRPMYSTDGFEFLNIYYKDIEIAIEWKSNGFGFGVSCYKEDTDELAGLYSSPDEHFEHLQSVQDRVVQIMEEIS